jgi:hypothetical protein
MSDAIGKSISNPSSVASASTRQLAERALAQLDDEQLPVAPGARINSHRRHHAAPPRQHDLALDGLSHDGRREASRDRDGEFILDATLTREERMARWEEGWRCCWGRWRR